MRAGNLPDDLGLVDINPTEMMFWMYCPISIPGDHSFHLPDNLQQFIPIIREARWNDHELFLDSYVYITAKTLWVDGDYIGNRPGWHIDGFGTDDINYIWSDRAPTEFLFWDPLIDLSDDCDASLAQMETLATFPDAMPECDDFGFRTYPDKHLLRLDNTVIHRSPVGFDSGMRTFVKISISTAQYNLKGNSINHQLPESHWGLVNRKEVRNHPTA